MSIELFNSEKLLYRVAYPKKTRRCCCYARRGTLAPLKTVHDTLNSVSFSELKSSIPERTTGKDGKQYPTRKTRRCCYARRGTLAPLKKRANSRNSLMP